MFFIFLEKLPSEGTFYGAHYLSYDLSSGGDPIVSSRDSVRLAFKTRQSSGLLFYTGKRKLIRKASTIYSTDILSEI